jgi:hypothetical protein
MRCPAEPFRYDEVRVIDNKTASSSTADLWISTLIYEPHVPSCRSVDMLDGIKAYWKSKLAIRLPNQAHQGIANFAWPLQINLTAASGFIGLQDSWSAVC